MEEYFYFTMHFNDTGERRFLGDLAMHWWESWEEAVECSDRERNMPLRSEWKIDGYRLVATFSSSGTTIELNSNGYEKYFIESLKG